MSQDTLRDIVLRLEGAVNTGFATIQGEINLLKSGQEETQKLRTDVDALKERRFPLPVIGGLVGFAALGLSAFTLVRGG